MRHRKIIMSTSYRCLLIFALILDTCDLGSPIDMQPDKKSTSSANSRFLFVQPLMQSPAMRIAAVPSTHAWSKPWNKLFRRDALHFNSCREFHCQLKATATDTNHQGLLAAHRKFAKSSTKEFIVHVVQELLANAHSAHKKHSTQLVTNLLRRRSSPATHCSNVNCTGSDDERISAPTLIELEKKEVFCPISLSRNRERVRLPSADEDRERGGTPVHRRRLQGAWQHDAIAVGSSATRLTPRLHRQLPFAALHHHIHGSTLRPAGSARHPALEVRPAPAAADFAANR